MFSKYTEDTQLIFKWQRGDEAAFRAFFDKYKNGLHLLFTSKLQDADLALDAMQELFSSIVRNPWPYLKVEKPKEYLFGSAHNIARNLQRSRMRRRRALKGNFVHL